MESIRTVIGRLLLILGSITFTLLLLEGSVRVFMPQQLILIRPDVWVPAAAVGHRHAADVNTVINTGERDVQLLTDARGYRIGSNKQGEAAYRVLALGDSYLAALQVEYEQTMTGRLEALLTTALGKTVVVVNTGVAGYDLNHYYTVAKQELKRAAYDLAVVFIYMPNDLINQRVLHFSPRQSMLTHELRFPEGLSSAELVDAVVYPVNDFLETRSHLYVLLKDKGRFALMRMGLSPYNFTDAILRSEAESPRWTLAGDIAVDIAAEAAAYGVPALFVLLPANYQIDEALTGNYIRALDIDPALIDLEQPSRLLGVVLEDRGLTVVDASETLKAAHASGQTDLYGRIDTHFGVNGHQVVAELLVPIMFDLLSK